MTFYWYKLVHKNISNKNKFENKLKNANPLKEQYPHSKVNDITSETEGMKYKH